jgi:hypothetical protein
MIRLVPGSTALLGAVDIAALEGGDCCCRFEAVDGDGFRAATNGTVKNAITATARATLDVFIFSVGSWAFFVVEQAAQTHEHTRGR